MRYAEQSAGAFGFVRCSSRLSCSRPRASLFAGDCQCTRTDPAGLLFSAFSSSLVPSHSDVEPYRLLQGLMDWEDLCGALRGSDGFAYQYIARAQASRQLLVQIWLAPAASRLDRAALRGEVTAEVFLRFIMICPASRPQPIYGGIIPRWTA